MKWKNLQKMESKNIMKKQLLIVFLFGILGLSVVSASGKMWFYKIRTQTDENDFVEKGIIIKLSDIEANKNHVILIEDSTGSQNYRVIHSQYNLMLFRTNSSEEWLNFTLFSNEGVNSSYFNFKVVIYTYVPKFEVTDEYRGHIWISSDSFNKEKLDKDTKFWIDVFTGIFMVIIAVIVIILVIYVIVLANRKRTFHKFAIDRKTARLIYYREKYNNAIRSEEFIKFFDKLKRFLEIEEDE